MDKTGKVMTEKNITTTIPENNLPTKFRVKCTVRKQFEINYMGRDDSQLHKHNNTAPFVQNTAVENTIAIAVSWSTMLTTSMVHGCFKGFDISDFVVLYTTALLLYCFWFFEL